MPVNTPNASAQRRRATGIADRYEPGQEADMPKSIIVAVAGATGKQGGAVARMLLHHGHQVRALTRRPESKAAAELQALGADIYEADLDDNAAVRRATRRADAFFLMATPYEAGVEAEVRQARTAAKAAKQASVKHLVYSSVASANQGTGVPHFDSKREVEVYIQKLGIPFTLVGPVFFMENLLGPMFIQGLRAGTLSMPLPASRPLQVVAVEDIAGFVRVVLERPSEFQGKRIDIASDSLTGPEMAKALSQAYGRDISYAEASLDPVRAQSTDLARMWEWFDQVGYTVDLDGIVRSYPDVGWHGFRRWAREQDLSVLDVAGPEQPTA
jgi:uncharacterized protein YbjT (DUF2867 family)